MLDKKYDFKENDAKWQNFWQEKEIFKFHANAGKKIYAIDTPPPTVNGAIHMGHLSSYIHIDALARHHKKLGEEIYFPFGFDDNGLPTERYVERKNKIHAHQMSRKDFTDLCLSETHKLEGEFAKLYKSMGYSANLQDCYSTIAKVAEQFHKNLLLNSTKRARFTEVMVQVCGAVNVAQRLLKANLNLRKFKANSTTSISKWKEVMTNL